MIIKCWCLAVLMATYTSCSKHAEKTPRPIDSVGEHPNPIDTLDTIPTSIDTLDTIPAPVDTIPKDVYTVYNKGVSGNTSTQLVKRVDEVIALKALLVVIMVGTNDVSFNVPTATYEQNLAFLVERIKAAGADVLLLSPPPRGKDVIPTPPDAFNARTDTLTAINQKLSTTLSCFYIDINKGYKDAGSPNSTASSLLFNQATNPIKPDGIHPNAAGMLFIANKVYDFISSKRPVKKYLTITCFGDSITGAEGSTMGYPPQLLQLLNK